MKNIVITGSSNGFGKLTALTMARKGHKVWATMRSANEKNLKAKEELLSIASAEGLKINVLELDVTIDASVQTAIEKIIAVDGSIDVLVNNAGVMYVGITEAYSLQQAQTQFDVNFFGIIRVTNAVLPHMRNAKSGQIINVSSLAGRLSFPYFGIYCASKHAVEAYSQSLRYEVAPFGIEVSVNEPGPFGTGLLFSGPQEANESVREGYGDFKDVPQAMLKNFEGFFETDEAPSPQLVADDIAKVIEAGAGNNADRVVSGIDYGVRDYNQLVAPIQENLVKEALQMPHLLEIAE